MCFTFSSSVFTVCFSFPSSVFTFLIEMNFSFKLLCLLCVTPLVCSSYSSFALFSPFISSWWQKIVSYLHIHLFYNVLHRHRRISPNSDRKGNPICSDVSQIQLDSSVISWLTVMNSLTCCMSIVASPPCGSSSFPAYRGWALVQTMPSALLPLVFICFPHPSLQEDFRIRIYRMEVAPKGTDFFRGKTLGVYV